MDDGSRETTGRTATAIKGVFWSAVSVVVPTLLSSLVILVTARILTPADFGTVGLATAIVTLAASVTPAGFGEALVQKRGLTAAHLDTVFYLCVAFGFVVYGVIVAASGLLQSFFEVPLLQPLLVLLALKVPIEMASVVPNALIRRSMAFQVVALRTFLSTFVAGLLSLALVLSGLGLWALAFSQLAHTAVGAIALGLAAGWRPGRAISRAAGVELSHYGFHATGSLFLNQVTTQAEPIMLGYSVGHTQLGFYNFARRLYSVINNAIAGTLGAVAHPLFSSVQHQRERVQSGFLIATFLSSVLAMPLFVGLAIIADRAVPLIFGGQWTEAVWPIRIFCVFGFLTCIGVLQSSFIKSQGKADWWFYYQLTSGIAGLAIVFALAPFGTIIMMLGLLVRTLLFFPVSIAMTLRLLDMGASLYLSQFLSPIFSATLMAGAILLRDIYWTLGSPWDLAIDIMLGAAVYGFAILCVAWRRIRPLGTVLRSLRARKKER